ncbi:MAG: GHKL domain-containing protein [Terrimonas sp.]|nr:GHKL domain-containing protein [Terrimonas sp.]
MFQQLLNWRTLLAVVAMVIVTGTIFYSKYLSDKIAKEEKEKVTSFAESLKIKALTNDDDVINFTNRIAVENKEIPIIETDENDQPTGIYTNLDSAAIAKDSLYLQKKIAAFRTLHDPVRVEITSNPVTYNKYYYGNTQLQSEVRYYPIIQLIIVTLFIIVTILALRSNHRSQQNQVWAGMAKETAHQLGTPVSSLEGWVEMMKEDPANEKIVGELEKDVSRLRLVSDRFGKIGSTPQLEERDIIVQVSDMMDYMKKRAAGKVHFSLDTHGENSILSKVSGPLFDWVIENLLKNALDALEGRGDIRVDIRKVQEKVFIDVSDTGKGISSKNVQKIFKPGFTTKKRGWGLGLSLSKRIIEQYHRGELYVKYSEPGKGTCFRIVLHNETR